jgi:hypothetical protein
MKNKLFLSLAIVALQILSPIAAFGQASGGVISGQYATGISSSPNYVTNPSCFTNVAGILKSSANATVSKVTGSSSVFGPASCSLSFTGSAETLKFPVKLFDKGLQNGQCEARGYYSGTTAGSVQAYVEQNSGSGLAQVSNTLTLENLSTGGKPFSFYFPCGGSTVTAQNLVFKSTITTTGAVVGGLQVGKATLGTSSFDFDLRNSGTIILNTGTKGTVANDLVRLGRRGDMARLRGEYKQTAPGSNGTAGDYLFTLPEGLQFDPSKVTFYTGKSGVDQHLSPIVLGVATASSSSATSVSIGGVIPYDATRFRLYTQYAGTPTPTNTAGAFIGAGYYNLGITGILTWTFDFEAPIQGWSSTAGTINPATSPWAVSAFLPTFPGSNTSTGSFVELSAAGVSAITLPGSDPVGITCPSGQTSVVGNAACAGGTSTNGITFNAKTTGPAFVCSHIVHSMDIANASDATISFSLEETSATSSTSVGAILSVDSRWSQYGVTNSNNKTHTIGDCALYNFTSTGQKTLRFKTKVTVNAGSIGSNISYGARINVIPVGQGFNTPFMVGGVVVPDNPSSVTYINTTANYTTSATLPLTIETAFADATAGSITLTLPDAVANKGKKFTVTKTDDSNNYLVTLSAATGQLIGPRLTTVLTGVDSVTVQSNGVKWNYVGTSPVKNASWTWTGSTVTNQVGQIVGGINTVGTGRIDFIIPSGVFQGKVGCTCSIYTGSASVNSRICEFEQVNATNVRVLFGANATNINYNAMVSCNFDR